LLRDTSTLPVTPATFLLPDIHSYLLSYCRPMSPFPMTRTLTSTDRWTDRVREGDEQISGTPLRPPVGVGRLMVRRCSGVACGWLSFQGHTHTDTHTQTRTQTHTLTINAQIVLCCHFRWPNKHGRPEPRPYAYLIRLGW